HRRSSHYRYSYFFFHTSDAHRDLHSFPTRRSSDLLEGGIESHCLAEWVLPEHTDDAAVALSDRCGRVPRAVVHDDDLVGRCGLRSEEHTSELQSRFDLVCRLLLEKKKKKISHKNNM